MRWLRQHQTAIYLIAVVAVAWGSIWLVYDYRSPVSQFMRGIGTVQIDGWSAYDLDTVCVRLEPATIPPSTKPEDAIGLANKTYPGGYVREVLLVSLHDTCNGKAARLAWAVSMSWSDTPAAPLPSNGQRPRAIVLVDAITGKLLDNHAQNQP